MAGGIVVFAYSEVGFACLRFLLDRGESVVALFTHEDAAGERLWFRSCAALAREHHVPVHTVEPRDGDAVEKIVRGLAPDLIFSFYYRRMIPSRILDVARLGAFNMHGSLLPKYRGRAPLNWAILHGETETGVTLHHMVKRADAGDIVDQERVPIGQDETVADIAPRLAAAAATLLARQIDNLKSGHAPRRAQDEAQASLFGGRGPDDGKIDWTLPAKRIVDLVRAVAAPFPGAFTQSGSRKLLIWRARAVEGAGNPGEILSLHPLKIAAGSSAVEAVHFGFEGESDEIASAAVLSSLRCGERLGE